MGSVFSFDVIDVKISVPIESSKPLGHDSIKNSSCRSYQTRDRHMRTLNKIRSGLHLSGATLATGEAVNLNNKTIQWLLEQIEQLAEKNNLAEFVKNRSAKNSEISKSEKTQGKSRKYRMRFVKNQSCVIKLVTVCQKVTT